MKSSHRTIETNIEERSRSSVQSYSVRHRSAPEENWGTTLWTPLGVCPCGHNWGHPWGHPCGHPFVFVPVDTPGGRPFTSAVSFHNFKSQNFKLSVSNPKSKYVAYLSVLSQISNCQGLGRKNKHEHLKTDRTTTTTTTTNNINITYRLPTKYKITSKYKFEN